MAALTPSAVAADGSAATKFSQGSPIVLTFTPSSALDTYTHPVGVSAWAIADQVTDAIVVTFAPSTRVFTIGSASQSGSFKLVIWQSK